jgi:hypothetical protein
MHKEPVKIAGGRRLPAARNKDHQQQDNNWNEG